MKQASKQAGVTAERSANRAPAKKQPDVSPFDELRAMQLYSDGLDDIAMADALGITAKRVQNWRLRMHLKRPRGGKKKTEKEQDMKKESSTSQASEQETSEPIRDRCESAAASCESAAEMQQTESSKNDLYFAPMTVSMLKIILARIESAGLGDIPVRICGANVKDFAVIALINEPGGPVISMR